MWASQDRSQETPVNVDSFWHRKWYHELQKSFKLSDKNNTLLLLGAFIISFVLGSIFIWILLHVGSIFRGLGRLGGVLEASWAVLGAYWGVLGAFRWSWAVPDRSRDVPRSARARIIDFSMVLGGLGGEGAVDVRGRALATRSRLDLLNSKKNTKRPS